MSQRIPYRSSRRGNYTMMMGSFLPILIGFAALSVDISFINMAHTQTQHVADAASHAAFVGYRATNSTTVGDSAANYILQQNLIGKEVGTLDSVEYGQWNFTSHQFNPSGQYINAARAAVSRRDANGNALQLFFAPLLGHNTANVEALGVTAGRTRQIMIVTDVSGSFDDDIGYARDANVAFLDYLEDHPYPQDKLGQTLFAGRGFMPVFYPLSLIETYYVPMRQRFLQLDTCDALPTASAALAPGEVAPVYLRGNPRNECNTSQSKGLKQARDQFIANGDPKEFQAIILLSDGLPNVHINQNTNDGTTHIVDKTSAEAIINHMWNGGTQATTFWRCLGPGNAANCGSTTQSFTHPGGVHVWTVTYENGGGDFTWMSSLKRGMGKAYNTPDPEDLEAIMIEIASSIPVVLTE